jgi:hypothetical protein
MRGPVSASRRNALKRVKRWPLLPPKSLFFCRFTRNAPAPVACDL